MCRLVVDAHSPNFHFESMHAHPFNPITNTRTQVTETILPLSRLGAGVLLINDPAIDSNTNIAQTDSSDADTQQQQQQGLTGAIISDYIHSAISSNGRLDEYEWCLVLLQNGNVIGVGPQHIRYIDVDDNQGLTREDAMIANTIVLPSSKRVWYPLATESDGVALINKSAITATNSISNSNSNIDSSSCTKSNGITITKPKAPILGCDSEDEQSWDTNTLKVCSLYTTNYSCQCV
jgi:hypothetical protein